MVTQVEVKEFKGVYVAPEAALYLKATLLRDVNIERPKYPIRAANLIHWIRVGLMSPELRAIPGSRLLIGFEDLVSMRVIAILRSLGVKWNRIHAAEAWLREKSGYTRPFAIEPVWTDTCEIFADFYPAFVAASRGGQLAFSEMLGPYLRRVRDMKFVPHNGVSVADSWTPHEDVLMNPRIQFGAPCLAGTRIRTRVISDLLKGGDTIAYLTRAFGLSERQVEHALEWEDRLHNAAKFN